METPTFAAAAAAGHAAPVSRCSRGATLLPGSARCLPGRRHIPRAALGSCRCGGPDRSRPAVVQLPAIHPGNGRSAAAGAIEGTGNPDRKPSPAAWIVTGCGDRCPRITVASGGPRHDLCQSRGDSGWSVKHSDLSRLPTRLLRGWKSIIELVFAAMAFRFGALRYSAPKREHPASADRSCRSVDAMSIDH